MAMRVYVDTAIPPFVEIDLGSSLLIFNDPDPTATKEMFEKVEKALAE